jgi:hypothetical protein
VTQRSLRVRALLWLYGNANICGCAIALAGPALLFAGVVHAGWLWITAGLYLAGYLLARRTPELEQRIEDSMTMQEITERLDQIIAQARPHLTDEMNKHLDNVRASIIEVLPRLVGARSHDDDWYTVRETVLHYLPETLANYVSLPPAFRLTQPLQQGRTARQLLADQLGLLDTKLGEIVGNVAASDAQALIANGKFLEAKFQQPDFLVR